jgi:hypothetical protein
LRSSLNVGSIPQFDDRAVGLPLFSEASNQESFRMADSATSVQYFYDPQDVPVPPFLAPDEDFWANPVLPIPT